jgi:hypothetical protein
MAASGMEPRLKLEGVSAGVMVVVLVDAETVMHRGA